MWLENVSKTDQNLSKCCNRYHYDPFRHSLAERAPQMKSTAVTTSSQFQTDIFLFNACMKNLKRKQTIDSVPGTHWIWESLLQWKTVPFALCALASAEFSNAASWPCTTEFLHLLLHGYWRLYIDYINCCSTPAGQNAGKKYKLKCELIQFGKHFQPIAGTFSVLLFRCDIHDAPMP